MHDMRTIIKFAEEYVEQSGGIQTKIGRNAFMFYAFHTKHFRESMPEALSRLTANILRRDSFSGDLAKSKQRIRRFQDGIDEAVRRNFLKYIPFDNGDGLLLVTGEGRQFVRLLPFIEAVLERYNRLASIVIACGATAAVLEGIPWGLAALKSMVDAI